MAARFPRQKPSPYKIEGEGGKLVGGSGKNIIVLVWFARCCAARRAIKKSADVAALPGLPLFPRISLPEAPLGGRLNSW